MALIRSLLRWWCLVALVAVLVLGGVYILLPEPCAAGSYCPSGPCCMTITINPDGTYEQIVYDCKTGKVVRVRVGILPPA